jgi:hypothetical protein
VYILHLQRISITDFQNFFIYLYVLYVAMLGGYLRHHGMVRPQVVDGGDGLQLWRVAANKMNKHSRAADKEWSSSLGVLVWTNNPCHTEISLL